MKREPELERAEVVGSAFGCAIVGGSLFGPVGLVMGALFGWGLGEVVRIEQGQRELAAREDERIKIRLARDADAVAVDAEWEEKRRNGNSGNEQKG